MADKLVPLSSAIRDHVKDGDVVSPISVTSVNEMGYDPHRFLSWDDDGLVVHISDEAPQGECQRATKSLGSLQHK